MPLEVQGALQMTLIVRSFQIPRTQNSIFLDRLPTLRAHCLMQTNYLYRLYRLHFYKFYRHICHRYMHMMKRNVILILGILLGFHLSFWCSLPTNRHYDSLHPVGLASILSALLYIKRKYSIIVVVNSSRPFIYEINYTQSFRKTLPVVVSPLLSSETFSHLFLQSSLVLHKSALRPSFLNDLPVELYFLTSLLFAESKQ